MSFMSRTMIPFGRVRGIPIRLHASLVLILPVLAVYFGQQLATASPLQAFNLPPVAWGGIVAAGLFLSVLVHELAHSLCALRLGGRVRSITLLFLGGVSEVEDALPPRREALVTFVGPLVSLILGAGIYLIAPVLGILPPEVRVSIRLVGALNLVLGVFNLAPAFPLDGGRLLRALLATRLGRLRATRVAVFVGKILAVGLAGLGLRSGDVSLIVVGAFIFFGAQREGSAVEKDEASGGLRVLDATIGFDLTLPAWTRARDAFRRFQTARADSAVVVDALDRPVGLVGAAAVAAVSEAMVIADLPGAQAGAICRDVPLFEALARLRAAAVRALPVIGPGGVLVGIVLRDDIERILDGTARRPLTPIPVS